jgi:protein-disulfide isomerase
MTEQTTTKPHPPVRHNPAGRTLLVITVIITFVAGIFGGYLLAKDRPVQENVLSADRYLIGIGDSPSSGPDSALVTIVEFNDVTCSECSRADHALRQAVDLYPGQVRVVWKNLLNDPTSQQARRAAEFGMAAAKGGGFWEIRDMIAVSEGKADLAKLAEYATDIGLDGTRLKDEVERGAYARRVQIDTDTAARMGVTKVPTVFVNGKRLLGEVTLEKVKAAVEAQMPEAKALLASGVSPIQIYWEIVKTGKTKLE